MPSKGKRKVWRTILRAVALLLLAAAAFALVSPLPVSFALRAAFRISPAVAPDNYEEIENQVEVIHNLVYPSEYQDNVADIYIPKDKEGPFPVVLWVHGGAFVGGSKGDVALYATALAAEGIAVVCMDYRRAPEAKYPVPVMQTEDAYLWLRDISDTYSFDIDRFVLAGDSAGAHIVAQFAAIQSSAAYADEMDFDQIVPLPALKAVLLFCGPFDAAKIDAGPNPVVNFLLARVAWAYFGTTDWSKDFAHQATISRHITESFPPTFISDGNRLSFEEHGRELADALRGSGVPVETCFIPIDTERTAHEYQFIMNTPAGKESFRQALKFLQEYTS